MSDPRVLELETWARENGLTLPLPADMIVFFEDQQRIVDLETGAVYNSIIVTPDPCAQAICHLMSNDDYAGNRTEY